MKARDYLKIITELAQLINEGIHIVDENGITIFYSTKMAELEQIRREDVLGKPYKEVFSHLPINESTLYKALKKKKHTYNKEQTYINKYGKHITTVNSTVPIVIDGKVAGAMEVANDITSIKDMTEAILELQGSNIRQSNSKNLSSGGASSSTQFKRYTFADLVGQNLEFRRQVEMAKKAASSKANVFIYGETGTGKELFAQSIHYGSSRAGKPFLTQNCSALPEPLLEIVLFGSAKNGIQGEESKPGLFEQANGGTLLLDEISAMPLELQSKLLRVLQEDYIKRVGSDEKVPIDVKLIATVNEPPAELIEKGVLRTDLFYRLNTIGLNLPPLRNRLDDLEILSEYLLEKHCAKSGKFIPGFAPDSLRKFFDYDFPGNVRELENCIASAVAFCEEDHYIEDKDLVLNPPVGSRSKAGYDFNSNEENLLEYMEGIERRLIEDALRVRQGNISQAADFLGIKRQTLQHKLKKYGL